jgi:hypothetical protein
LVKEEAAWLLSTQYESKINSLNNQGFVEGGASLQKMKGAAIELIYYERRSKKHPSGRMVSTANGVLLADKELPVGEIPLVKFDDIQVAGKYYSEAFITHFRPIQDQYNRSLQKRSEWVNKLLAGKYIAFRGSNLTQESLNDQSGEVVLVDPVPNAPNAGMPVPMQMPNIPQFVYTEDAIHEKNMNDISGISEVSRGQLPSAGMPAIGMQLLTEQDDSRIGVMTEANEEAWALVGKLILMYVQKYYTMPRLLKVAGKAKEYTVKSFVGADLKGNDDVICIRGSTLPGSKTLKRQDILSTYMQGLMGDPKDPKVRETVLEALEFGDVAEVWLDQGLDKAQINKTIQMIESEQLPPVNKLDNHPYFILELNRYRKGDKFDSLSDVAKNLLESCIDQHVTAIMEISQPPMPMPPPGSGPIDPAALQPSPPAA